MDISNYLVAILIGVAVMLGFTGAYGNMRNVYTDMDTLDPTLEQVSNHMVVSVNNSVISMQNTLKSGDWLTTATDLVFIAPMNAIRTIIDIVSGSMGLFGAFFGSIYIMPAWSVGLASTILYLFIILAVVSILLKYKV